MEIKIMFNGLHTMFGEAIVVAGNHGWYYGGGLGLVLVIVVIVLLLRR